MTIDPKALLTDEELEINSPLRQPYPGSLRVSVNAAAEKAARFYGAENARLRELLEDAVSLVGSFAGTYLSKDGTTVVETRGSMGRDLAAWWPAAHAALGPPAGEGTHDAAP